jgi:formylmethanofuran dehydrogenase subunit E
MATLTDLLAKTTARHDHLCPRQVLGVRIGLLVADVLQLALPQSDKRLLTFVETDGCFADGVAVATGCELGHRTLRLMDYGKVAATVIDTKTGRAIRVAPNPAARQNAARYAPNERSHWHTMLAAYQAMPTDELLCWKEVHLTLDVDALISRPGVRVNCAICGEEILNQREVIVDGATLCRACAGESYYKMAHECHFEALHA